MWPRMSPGRSAARAASGSPTRPADGQQRISELYGSWKITCNSAASSRRGRGPAWAMSVAGIPDRSFGDRRQSEDRATDRRLARARLADERDGLGLADIETDVVDGTESRRLPTTLARTRRRAAGSRAARSSRSCPVELVDVGCSGSADPAQETGARSARQRRRRWRGGSDPGSGSRRATGGKRHRARDRRKRRARLPMARCRCQQRLGVGVERPREDRLASACSTIWLAYMTTTRVAMSATIPQSWVTSSKATPVCCCTARSRSRISA